MHSAWRRTSDPWSRAKKADVILVDWFKPHLVPMNMPVYRMVYFANAEDVVTVLVDGGVLMRDRKVLTVNEEDVLIGAQREADLAMRRAGLQDLTAMPGGSGVGRGFRADPVIHVVLVHPEIHWNTGNAGRTCLATGARLHLVKPLGFSLDEREVKVGPRLLGVRRQAGVAGLRKRLNHAFHVRRAVLLLHEGDARVLGGTTRCAEGRRPHLRA